MSFFSIVIVLPGHGTNLSLPVNRAVVAHKPCSLSMSITHKPTPTASTLSSAMIAWHVGCVNDPHMGKHAHAVRRG